MRIRGDAHGAAAATNGGQWPTMGSVSTITGQNRHFDGHVGDRQPVAIVKSVLGPLTIDPSPF
jgi:hypothetical protein